MIDDNAVAIVLAAGLGTRMRSAQPKVLHEIAGLPMLAHVLAAAEGAGLSRQVIVTGPDGEGVRTLAGDAGGRRRFAVQSERNGTGHAVLTARCKLAGDAGSVFVLYGDTPLIRAETIRAMDQELGHADLVVVSFTPDDPGRYGRLIEDQAGNVVAIREHADASAEERGIRTCFSGLMAFGRARDLDLLDDLRPDNVQGEYYLTDLVAIGRGRGLTIRAVEVDPVDVVGVNSRAELAVAEEAMQERLRARAMAEGATLVAPRTVQLSHDTVLESDVLVEPNVVFGPGVRVRQGAQIRAFSHLEAAEIESGAIVGPFARLRPGAHIGEGAHIGNFVEIKNAVIDEGAKANHLSYIGDAHVGAGANIGAGTITCNYDGFAKHHTEIGAGAFIGSNSSLVAPVSVGEGAYVASGSVVTRVVEAGALAVARGRQENKPGWSERFRESRARPRKARKVGGPDRSE